MNNGYTASEARVGSSEDVSLSGLKKPGKEQGSVLVKELGFLLLKIAAVIVAFVLLFTFVFGFCRAADDTMAPNFKNGDFVLFYRLDTAFVASDVVVVEFEGQQQLRRVVAIEGDTVDIAEEGIRINGALQSEADTYGQTLPYTEGIDYPVTLGSGQVFLLADYRDGPADSRVYGPVDGSDIEGKVITFIRRRGF